MSGIRCRLLIVGTLLFFQSTASAATVDSLNDVRRFLTETYPSDRPGAAVVVMEHGKIVHQSGYGLANVEHGAQSGPGPTTVASLVAAMIVDDPYPERVTINLRRRDLVGLEGTYHSDEFPPITLSIEDGRLRMDIGTFAYESLSVESRDRLFVDDSLNFIDVRWRGSNASELHPHLNEGEPPMVLHATPN